MSGTWGQEAELFPNGQLIYDQVRCLRDIENNVAMIGAWQGECLFPGVGKAYEFIRTGTTWTNTRALLPLGSQLLVGSGFGISVAMAGGLRSRRRSCMSPNTSKRQGRRRRTRLTPPARKALRRANPVHPLGRS